MTIDLSEFGLGIVSLFPAIGRIERLRGFYPRGLRGWFVTISTVFSLIVYLVVVLHFEKLQFYLPVLWSTTAAAASLVIYVVIHLIFKDRSPAPSGIQRGVLAGSMLVLYVLAISLLTYTFNTLNQLRTYSVYRGKVMARDTGTPLAGAELTFSFVDGSSKQVTSGDEGEFLAIIEREPFSALEVIYGPPDLPSHCRSWTASQVPGDRRITLFAERCSGG